MMREAASWGQGGVQHVQHVQQMGHRQLTLVAERGHPLACVNDRDDDPLAAVGGVLSGMRTAQDLRPRRRSRPLDHTPSIRRRASGGTWLHIDSQADDDCSQNDAVLGHRLAVLGAQPVSHAGEAARGSHL